MYGSFGTNTESEAFETVIVGPMALDVGDPRTLMWLAKAGPIVVGFIRLTLEQPQVGLIRDLQISSDVYRTRHSISARLLSAVAEYARDHSVLKLNIHLNSRFDWVGVQLARFGFSDAEASNGRMQYYLDLYRPTHRPRPTKPAHRPDPARLSC